ncbi:MAG TPA: hypothetical protein VIB48_22425 [Acidimicrobiia bacterium]
MQDLEAALRATAGMRRVDCVRMVEGEGIRFFVDGIGHRLPVSREVPPSVAHALMQDVPLRHVWAPPARGRR